jgi:periplasmic protein TonB
MHPMRIVLLAALLLAACSEPPPEPREFRAEAGWWEPVCGKLRVAQVGGADVAPRVVHRVDPVWPDVVRRAEIRGNLIIAAVITERGEVCDARVIRGFGGQIGLDAGNAALRAVKQWRFAPATKQGTPVAALYHLTIKFDLRSDATMPRE